MASSPTLAGAVRPRHVAAGLDCTPGPITPPRAWPSRVSLSLLLRWHDTHSGPGGLAVVTSAGRRVELSTSWCAPVVEIGDDFLADEPDVVSVSFCGLPHLHHVGARLLADCPRLRRVDVRCCPLLRVFGYRCLARCPELTTVSFSAALASSPPGTLGAAGADAADVNTAASNAPLGGSSSRARDRHAAHVSSARRRARSPAEPGVIGVGFLSHCPRLKRLDVHGLAPGTVLAGCLVGATRLQRVTVRVGRIKASDALLRALPSHLQRLETDGSSSGSDAEVPVVAGGDDDVGNTTAPAHILVSGPPAADTSAPPQPPKEAWADAEAAPSVAALTDPDVTTRLAALEAAMSTKRSAAERDDAGSERAARLALEKRLEAAEEQRRRDAAAANAQTATAIREAVDASARAHEAKLDAVAARLRQETTDAIAAAILAEQERSTVALADAFAAATLPTPRQSDRRTSEEDRGDGATASAAAAAVARLQALADAHEATTARVDDAEARLSCAEARCSKLQSALDALSGRHEDLAAAHEARVEEAAASDATTAAAMAGLQAELDAVQDKLASLEAAADEDRRRWRAAPTTQQVESSRPPKKWQPDPLGVRIGEAAAGDAEAGVRRDSGIVDELSPIRSQRSPSPSSTSRSRELSPTGIRNVDRYYRFCGPCNALNLSQ